MTSVIDYENLHRPIDISVGLFKFQLRVLQYNRPLSGDGFKIYLMARKASGGYRLLSSVFVVTLEQVEEVLIDTKRALHKGYIGIKAVDISKR